MEAYEPLGIGYTFHFQGVRKQIFYVFFNTILNANYRNILVPACGQTTFKSRTTENDFPLICLPGKRV
jgi:hypothetical protein